MSDSVYILENTDQRNPHFGTFHAGMHIGKKREIVATTPILINPTPPQLLTTH